MCALLLIVLGVYLWFQTLIEEYLEGNSRCYGFI